jgi:hypothetical protein
MNRIVPAAPDGGLASEIEPPGTGSPEIEV